MIANRFWVLEGGTWDASDTTHWATTSGAGVGGASVPGIGDAVIFDALSAPLGGTCSVNTTVTVQSITMGAFTGTLDFSANNNNVTLSLAFDCTGTGIRTLNMGNGLWTMQGFNNNTWNITTATNLTLNANSSILSFIPSSATPTGNMTFIGGSKSYNTVTHSGATNAAIFLISGNPTIATFQITAPVSLTFTAGTTTTITNAFTWAGTSSNQVFITSDNPNSSATVAAPANSSISWAGIRRMTFTGNTVLAPNSFDLRSNSGVTITPPSSGSGSGARIISG